MFDFAFQSPRSARKSRSNQNRFAPAASLIALTVGLAGCSGDHSPYILHTISGTVTGAVSSGVTVSLSGMHVTRTTTTNATGGYAFSDLITGSYTITPTLAGYVFTPANQMVSLGDQDLSNVGFTAAASSGVHSISGAVTGAVTSGVIVRLTGANTATTTTDGAGNYVFSNLADGNYAVTPSLGSYLFSPVGTAVLLADADVTGKDFAAEAYGYPVYSISGQVTMAHTGAALPGVVVTLSGGNTGSTMTDSLGNYIFSGLKNGSYTVTPSRDGYTFSPASQSLTIIGGNVPNQSFVATAHNYTVTGTVGGIESFNVAMTLRGASGYTQNVTTDQQGNYTFTGLDSGEYTVTPSLPGYEFTPKSLTVTVSDANVVVTQMFLASQGCLGRWCWENPLPQGNELRGVWGSGANDVWAVGAAGTILHWEGPTNGWTSVTSGTTNDLYGVWGSDASDVWAVGYGGTTLHWNGSAWTSVSSGTKERLLSVWGSSANDVWAVGEDSTTLRWTGSAWSPVSNPLSGTSTYRLLYGVWGSGASDVWAVGSYGTILRWTGSGWSSVSNPLSGTSDYLYGVWGSSSTNVWAVGSGGIILRWDGSAWNKVESGTSRYLYGGVWGSSSSDVWALGDQGTILRWNGSAWSSVSNPLNGTGISVNCIWGSSSSDVWAVGYGGTILRWNGSTWSSGLSGTGIHVNSVWGSTTSDVWAVGYGGTILRSNGSAWSSVPNPLSGTSINLYGVWGSSANDVWAVGDSGTTLRWTGSAWSNITSGVSNQLASVWGSSASDVWAVGSGGITLHWTGSAWSNVANPLSGTSKYLYGVWGSSSSNVWAVGGGGNITNGGANILHWDGNAWSSVLLPLSDTMAELYGVWGSSSSNVWAVGSGGIILRWNGSANWQKVESGALNNLYGVSGSSYGDSWAVGDTGTILKWNGSAWPSVSSGTTNHLYGVWGSGANDMWAVGHYGTILHWRQ